MIRWNEFRVNDASEQISIELIFNFLNERTILREWSGFPGFHWVDVYLFLVSQDCITSQFITFGRKFMGHIRNIFSKLWYASKRPCSYCLINRQTQIWQPLFLWIFVHFHRFGPSKIVLKILHENVVSHRLIFFFF